MASVHVSAGRPLAGIAAGTVAFSVLVGSQTCQPEGYTGDMATDRHMVHNLVEQLPDSELTTARRFLEFLSHNATGEEIDEQTAAEIRASLADPKPDIPHDELWARLDRKCVG